MDTSYDEDITQNPFFVDFQTEHPELFNQCIVEGWVLCVPRVTTILSQIFTLQDFLGHVLVCNDELPATHFMTLTDKTIRVANRIISTEHNNENGLPSEIRILFEETFYTADKSKYKVWCVEFPLELEYTLKTFSVVSHCKSLSTLRDCIDFLWTECSGNEVLERMDIEINHCKNTLLQIDNNSMNNFKDMIGILFTNCLNIPLTNQRLKEKCKNCRNTMNNLKLAVETYILHGTYKELFELLCMCSALEDSKLNKIIRNLSDIQVHDLNVKQDFLDSIPVARKNLSLIQSYGTIVGKVCCIQNTITTFNKVKHSHNYVSTDELLPILIFLVLKSGIPNWLAHLNFLKHFRFSANSFHQSDEFSYCISTLEAVIEQIKSGLFPSSCSLPESQCCFNENEDSFEMIGFVNDYTPINKESDKECTDNLQYLFEQIKLSDFDKVKEILEQTRNVTVDDDSSETSSSSSNLKYLSLEDVFNEEESSDMCHPLCSCNKCCRLVSSNLIKTSPNVHSKDIHGFTALHVAVLYNRIHIVDLVLEMGADVNSIDNSGSSPLHHAAAKGHQTAMLLLLHVGANFNKQNTDKNTPLHLACNNGHDSCVKALIYFCEQSKTILNLQAANENGDTPLHLASKWGYQSIIRILLENGAEPWIKNCELKTPMDVAHSRVTTNILLFVKPNMFEYVKVTYDLTEKKSHVKSDLVLLDLNDKPTNKINNNVIFATLSETNKPKCTVDIHHIERLFRAITFGDVKLACFYMNVEFNPDLKDDTSNTDLQKIHTTNQCHPLCSCLECAESKLLDNNLNFNINMCDSKGDTSLHIAVINNRLEICNILLNNGAIADIKNNVGRTSLHIAAQENKVVIMKLLLKFTKNIKCRDSSGNTPLHLACRAGSIEAVKCLLHVEPYEEIRNLAYRTALDEAKEQINLTIIDLLQENLKKN